MTLDGNTVLPGLCDTHVHLTAYARQKLALDLSQVGSKDELFRMIREHAADTKPGDWMFAIGFNETRWPENEIPTRFELDGLQLPNPIHLVRTCGHVHVASSNALKRSGVACGDDHPGIFHEEDANRIVATMEREMYSPRETERILKEACREFAALGVTSIHACSADSYGLGEDYPALQALNESGELPLRITLYDETLPALGIRSGFGDEFLRYGGFKVFLDGALGPRSAALSAPYADDPGNWGVLNHNEEDLLPILQEAQDRCIQTQIHAIGDAAIDQFLSLANKLDLPRSTPFTYPLRLNHVQLCRPDQIAELAHLKDAVVCDIQSGMVPTDMSILGQRLGSDRSEYGYFCTSLLNAGLLVCGSSDAGCEQMNPWRGIWAAVNRVNDEGAPKGGWKPEEKVSLEEALTLYTVNGHRSAGRSETLGKIKPGYKADITVLNRDVASRAPETLQETEAVLTLTKGRAVWGNPEDWR
ncbi:MAG: amidohydrolase [Synergistales bacterium]|nr:amidohydrolase [Synergistales bacterium]